MNRSHLLRRVLSSGVPPLLDSYPATVAYSLRYLSSDFEGNDVITVRRSSDDSEQGFTPTEITDGTLASFCGAGDGFIKTWFDQSGNGYNTSQGTHSRQPKIVNSGTLITENGNPFIDFDGVDDDLLSINIGERSQPNTFFSVHKFDTTGPNKPIFGGISTSFRNQLFANGPDYRFYAGTAVNCGFTVSGNVELATALFSTSSSILYINGVAGNVVNPGTHSITGIQLGSEGVNNADCKISELIYYDGDRLSDRSEIESNINNYYGVF